MPVHTSTYPHSIAFTVIFDMTRHDMTYITFVHPSTHSSISTHIPTYLPTDLPTYTTSVVEGSWEAKFRETDDL